MTPVITRTYPPPPIDRREVLRYARSNEQDEAAVRLLPDILGEAEGLFTYRVAFRTLPLTVEGGTVTAGPLSVASQSLAARLAGCTSALAFAATVGIGIDRRLARYTRTSPARALLLSALGSERCEALVEAFVADLQSEGLALTPRFSPGYGDLPLTLQRELLPLLDAGKTLGITLTEGNLMTPTKSVTALAGINGDPLR